MFTVYCLHHWNVSPSSMRAGIFVLFSDIPQVLEQCPACSGQTFVERIHMVPGQGASISGHRRFLSGSLSLLCAHLGTPSHQQQIWGKEGLSLSHTACPPATGHRPGTAAHFPHRSTHVYVSVITGVLPSLCPSAAPLFIQPALSE